MDNIYILSVSYVSEEDTVKATIRKKTYNLDAEMIEKVRRLFNAKTDTEAIRAALRKAVEDREIQESLDALLREGRFRTIYRRRTSWIPTYILGPFGRKRPEPSLERPSSRFSRAPFFRPSLPTSFW